MHGPVRTGTEVTCKVYGIIPFGCVWRRSGAYRWCFISPFLCAARYFTDMRGRDAETRLGSGPSEILRSGKLVTAWDGERRRHTLAHSGIVAARQSNDRRLGPLWTMERLLTAASSTTLPVHSTRSWFSLHTSVRRSVAFHCQSTTLLSSTPLPRLHFYCWCGQLLVDE